MNGFDYTPLRRKIQFTEYLRAPGGWIVKTGMITALVLLAIGMFGSVATGSLDAFISCGYVAAAFALGGCVGIGIAHRNIRLADFAAANHLTLDRKVPYDNRAGIIFGEGSSRVFTEIYQAVDRPFAEIGNFRYVVGSGRDRRNVTHGFVRIKLPRRLPNMVLDARSNNIFGFSNLPIGFSANQRLELEGDFNKYFTLYAPAEYKLDALYIFTPDVMQALIESAHKYDCEVVDDDLYIYSNQPIAMIDPARLEEILKLSQLLHRELGDQTDYYADDRVGNRALNVIDPSGARLKTRLSTVGIIAVVATLGYMLISMLPLFSQSH